MQSEINKTIKNYKQELKRKHPELSDYKIKKISKEKKEDLKQEIKEYLELFHELFNQAADDQSGSDDREWVGYSRGEVAPDGRYDPAEHGGHADAEKAVAAWGKRGLLGCGKLRRGRGRFGDEYGDHGRDAEFERRGDA